MLKTYTDGDVPDGDYLAELDAMVDNLCDKHGNSRVIAVNGRIMELLEKAYKMGYNEASHNSCGCLGFLD